LTIHGHHTIGAAPDPAEKTPGVSESGSDPKFANPCRQKRRSNGFPCYCGYPFPIDHDTGTQFSFVVTQDGVMGHSHAEPPRTLGMVKGLLPPVPMRKHGFSVVSFNANERLSIAETGLGIQVVWRGKQIVLDTQDLLLYLLPVPKQVPSSFELRKENNPTNRGGFL
jgi:hypothetical protein